MSRHDRERFDLEGELGAARPRAPRHFIDTLAARVGATRSGVRGARPAVVALVGIGSLAVMGGIGFAASTAIESSQVAVKRVTADSARTIAIRNAAQHAYNKRTAVVVAGLPEVSTTTSTATGQRTRDAKVRFTLSGNITTNESGTLWVAVEATRAGAPAPVALGLRKVTGKETAHRSGEIIFSGERSGKVAKSFRHYFEKPGTITVTATVIGSEVEPGDKLNLVLRFQDVEVPNLVSKVEIPATAPACTLRIFESDTWEGRRGYRRNVLIRINGSAEPWCAGLEVKANPDRLGEATINQSGRFAFTFTIQETTTVYVTFADGSARSNEVTLRVRATRR